jgi:hypothetical protein
MRRFLFLLLVLNAVFVVLSHCTVRVREFSRVAASAHQPE